MEQPRFENNDQEPKRQFIVINYDKPDDIPLFAGEASSEEEARELVEAEAPIKIDYEKHPEIAIAFLNPGQEEDNDRLAA